MIQSEFQCRMDRRVPPVPAKCNLTKDRLKTTDSHGYTVASAPRSGEGHIYEDLRQTLAGPTPFHEVSFQLNLDDIDADSKCETAVYRLVSSFKLPLIVKVKRNFSGLGSDVVRLQKDDILLFHFIGRIRRVLTIDESGRKMMLPIQAKQVYHILPSVQQYDDKVFKGTKAVIEAKPLPKRLRILEAHYSIILEESQEVGDVIEISHVERRHTLPLKTGFSNRVLIGKYNGNNNTFAFPESMTCSTYSAIISDKPCPLSEILEKYPLPIDKVSLMRIRSPNDKRAYLLKEYRDDILVIATYFNSQQVLAIPVTCQIDVEKETNLATERLLHGLLPAMYPLLNCSYGIVEVGRPALHEDLRQIPRPIETILNQWKESYEGQKFLQLNSKGKNKYLKYEMEAKARKKKTVAEQFSKSSSDEPPKIPPKPSSRKIRDEDDATDQDRPLPNIPPTEDLKELLDKKEKEIQNLLQENKERKENYEKLKEELAHLKDECSQQNDPQDGEYFKRTNEQDLKQVNEETDGIVSGGSAIDEKSSKVKLLSASVEEVGYFLKDLGLDSYVPGFQEEVVNGELLVKLDEDILKEDIGMKKIQARRLMLEVSKRLRHEEESDRVFEAVEHQERTREVRDSIEKDPPIEEKEGLDSRDST